MILAYLVGYLLPGLFWSALGLVVGVAAGLWARTRGIGW